jgi:hypothetical protein
MFKYSRILILLVAVAIATSIGCSSSSQPKLGADSGLKEIPHSRGVKPTPN